MTVAQFWRRVRFAFQSDSFDRELKEEMRLHEELRTEKIRRSGVPHEEAAVAARRQFGNATFIAEDSRNEWSFQWLESLLQDTRYALRTFRRAPLFSCGVAGTIGIGLGLMCSLFTIFNAYVLRTFAVRDPHSLYQFSWRTKAGGRQSFNWSEFERLRADKSVFSEVLATGSAFSFLDGRAFPGRLVTGNYFSMLGVRAALGRTLLPFDSEVRGAQAVVVLSYQAWKNRFDSDPNVVGKKIAIRSQIFEIVGVAQAEFSGIDGSSFKLPAPDFWAPLTMARHFYASDVFNPAERGTLSVVGRLKPEVTEGHAKAALEISARHTTAELRDADRPEAFFLDSRATAIPLTPPLLATFSVVLAILGLVLLIACANVANMMLARGMSRQREIGVRLSLGAGRARLVRQLLLEAILLSLPGGAVAFALAFGVARFGPSFVLFKILPPEFASVMRFPPLDPDLRVFLFALAAAVFAAVLFGIVPAMQSTRASLTSVARGEFGKDLNPARLRNALVITQVMFCVMFLVSASVLLRGSLQLADRDLRMKLDQVADIDVPQESRARIVERLSTQPWSESLALAWRSPLYGALRTVSVLPSGSKEEIRAGYNFVSPEYFEVLGIPLKRGRNFTRRESDGAVAVVIVSEATAQRFWPNQDPVGRSLVIGKDNRGGSERAPTLGSAQVIGVAGDVISGMIQDGIDRTCLYFPIDAQPGRMAVLLRFKGNVSEVRRLFASAVERVVPQAEWRFVPMKEVALVTLLPFRVASMVAWLLGSLALILTLSGIYGVLSYLVSQRTKEIGIRMALGASTSAVLQSVLAKSFKLTAAGAAIGLLLALGLSRLMAANMEMINTFDWPAYMGSIALILFIALAAGYLPSRRAARVDPAVTLRSD